MSARVQSVRFHSLAGLVLASCSALYAGPLSPPAGPITSTYKTLTEVEPRVAINATNTPGDAGSLFRIINPGSYYLSGNITGIAGKHGISILTTGVTIDLNGFVVSGVAGSLSGIVSSTPTVNVTIRNGVVRDWGVTGIRLLSTAQGSPGCTLENVTCISNVQYGAYVADAAVVSNSRFESNGLYGLVTGTNAAVRSCTANGNQGGGGIAVGTGSSISDCTARQNLTGFSADVGCVVTDCSSFDNNSHGIFTGPGCTVSNCTAYSNTGEGIFLGTGCTASNCTANSNTGSGIKTGGGCTVADCTANSNTLDGIVCSSSCVIRGNNCSSNGLGAGSGAGIRVTSSSNRIEGNNCTAADIGIAASVSGSNNLIFRNTCSGNSINWNVAAGNTILVVQGTTAGIVSGNTGGIAPGSTDPNANFSY